jgi:hypothetical protein
MYCKSEVDSVIDVCRACGLAVWGENMFNAIVQNMEGAKESGDLYQGSVGIDVKNEEDKISVASTISQVPSAPSANSLVQDAVAGLDAMNSDIGKAS